MLIGSPLDLGVASFGNTTSRTPFLYVEVASLTRTFTGNSTSL